MKSAGGGIPRRPSAWQEAGGGPAAMPFRHATLALCLALPCAAAANEPPDASFTVFNRGDRDILEMFVATPRQQNWGGDRLGDRVLEPGQRFTVRLPPGQCLNRLRLVLEGDEVRTRELVDTCATKEIALP
jgi:hypothetical protein